MIEQKGISPAALGALALGDFENFIAASTPGGIEAQEAAGQAALVKSANRLPIKISHPHGITHDDLARELGIVFGGQVDDIFIEAALPAGWAIKATGHSMWSELFDERDRKRAGIFYKAAFYDRNAHMEINQRYFVTRKYADDDSCTFCVIDNATSLPIHTGGTAKPRDWEAQDAICKETNVWLQTNYPDYANPFAYWNSN